MSELRKIIKEIILQVGSPGDPGYPGRPAIPEYYETKTVTVCGYVWYTYDGDSGIPIRSPGYEPGFGGGFFQWECWPETVTIYHPPQPAIPAIPPTPPTPDIIIRNLNIGWNSHSRTIDPIGRGEFLQYNLGAGVTGAVFGVGLKGMDDGTPAQYAHALVFDVSGIRLYERGKVGQKLYGLPPAGTVLRIYRDWNKAGNKISYYVKKADGSTIIEASTTTTISSLAKLYVYSWLYTGGDRVPEADYLMGEVMFAKTQDA
ncbi:MAG: hypothetical protein RBT66_09930 [bacterium]|jgi:hypothetical protein|nr:hypothetical protein [Dehalococcoidia bacterium]MDX9781341.1 hypothetical protein [bacterium]